MKTLRILLLLDATVTAAADLEDDIALWKDYEKVYCGLDLIIDLVQISIPNLEHKPFGIVSISKDHLTGNNIEKELFGLKDIKDRVRALNVVPDLKYQSVMFVYDITKTPWYAMNQADAVSRVANWTYFEPLSQGTMFTEVVVSPNWPATDPFRVLSHEIRHACVGRLRLLGYPAQDIMDNTPVVVDCASQQPAEGGKCSAYFPYYKEFETYATDGNRAAQNKLLAPYFDFLTSEPEKKNRIAMLTLLLGFYNQLLALMTKKDTPGMIAWADGIKTHEGWFVGSRSQRNFNPGNFRYTDYLKSLGAIGEDRSNVGVNQKGFAIFPSYAVGYEALLQFLRDARANKLTAYRKYATNLGRPGGLCTLRDFFEVYAPASDNNAPLVYSSAVAKKIGVSVDAPINSF